MKIFSAKSILACLACFAVTVVICVICGAAFLNSDSSPHQIVVCAAAFSVVLYFIRSFIRKKTDCSVLMSAYIASGGIISVAVLIIGTLILCIIDGGFSGWGFVIAVLAVLLWAAVEAVCMGLSLLIEKLVGAIVKNAHKKKLIIMAAASLFAVLAGSVIYLWGPEITPDRCFEYTVSGNEITIAEYNGPYLNVTVPETINGMPVTKIGGYAFSDKNFLLSVKLPDSVNELEGRCFSFSNYLYSVRLSENLKEIPSGCFMCSRRLAQVEIPDSVEVIGSYSFDSCYGLKEVIFHEGSRLRDIGDKAFYYNSSLRSVKLPDGVETIGEEAFYDCKKLSDVYLGKNLREMGARNFSSCAVSSPVEVPQTIEHMGNQCFEHIGFVCEGREYHEKNGFSQFYRDEDGQLTDNQVTPQKE